MLRTERMSGPFASSRDWPNRVPAAPVRPPTAGGRAGARGRARLRSMPQQAGAWQSETELLWLS
jgi:hypothetical protein